MSSFRPTTIVYIATSLDRFIARTDGSIDWLGEPDPSEDYGWADFIRLIDHIVMGRNTFEKVLSFGEVWPYEGTPLTVLSSTLDEIPMYLQGKVDILSLQPSAVLDHLRNQGRKRIYVDGGETIQRFLQADLIDELILTTLPVLIGSGIPLFGSIDSDMAWEHVSTKTFNQGIVQSVYHRNRDLL